MQKDSDKKSISRESLHWSGSKRAIQALDLNTFTLWCNQTASTSKNVYILSLKKEKG